MIRAGEMFGLGVFDQEGRKLGHVYELEAVLVGKRCRVEHLLVGSAAALLHLGFAHRSFVGPPGLAWLARRLSGYRIPWKAIERIEADRVLLSVTADDLELIHAQKGAKG